MALVVSCGGAAVALLCARLAGWRRTAEDYVPLFKALGVTAVVRFNKALYDRRIFTEVGINHHDLFYEDGMSWLPSCANDNVGT